MQQVETIRAVDQGVPVTNASVLIIGGAEDKVHGREILQTFFDGAGGREARLAIVPCASREPAIISERYRRIFSEMGATHIEVLDIRDRSQGEDPNWQRYIAESTGVFMTGGDQVRLCGLLADTPLIAQIRQQAQLGQLTLAGTSAGAAVMGEHMIAGGGSGETPNRSLVDMAAGLGIVPELVVDQHFHNRNRMARLLSAVAMQPDRLGIGIDEDTCIRLFTDGHFQVIGKGAITVVDPGTATYTNQPDVGPTDPLCLHEVKVHLLVHGDQYNIKYRKLL
ncbi:MAG: cyanophycinase [Cyanobacteria bacterium P01_A01_bin.105]